jgi:hypothetical protein
MAEEDLLAAAVRENPTQTAVYDRRGKSQTDGMITLADCYGINKMAMRGKGAPLRFIYPAIAAVRAVDAGRRKNLII